MLRIIRALARQPYVAELCRREGIAVDTWFAIATNDAIDADSNGRGMRTSQTVAAARVGRSERTVRRARSISVRIGILVELYRGRELTRAERLALVTDSPGHQQRGIPNVYAVTLQTPRHRAMVAIPEAGHFALVFPTVGSFGHLPVGNRFSPVRHLFNVLPLADADASEARKRASSSARSRRRRPGSGLAVDLLAQPSLQILLEGIRPGQIAAQIAPFEAGGWKGGALAAALLVEASRIGVSRWEPARSPFGLLKALLAVIAYSPEIHQNFVDVDERSLSATERPQSCGQVECDGYGWINLTLPDGHHVAQVCPDCPPQIRSTAAAAEFDFAGDLPF